MKNDMFKRVVALKKLNTIFLSVIHIKVNHINIHISLKRLKRNILCKVK